MAYRLFADIVVILHLAFILFVILGGLPAIRWRKIIWIHIPAALWGALIELIGWICPLTPLENWLRLKGGVSGYPDGFVEHYILPIIYPVGLTREVQVSLGTLVIIVNLLIYSVIFVKYRSGS